MRRSLAEECDRYRWKGSAAREHLWAPGRRLTALLLACALMLAVGGAQAQAAPKGVVDFFGATGTAGAQFNAPRGVAVNQTSGDIYVADSTNHRVQRFDALQTFVSAWGRDVVRPGAAGNVPVNERQTVTVVATGGTFTLTFSGQTTAAIAFDATAAELQAALEGLSNVDPGDVSVNGDAGGPWTVEFAGALADTDVAQMTGSATDLIGDPKSVTVATTTEGASAFEICTMAISCKQGSAGVTTDGPAGELSSPQGIAIDSDGSVYVTDLGNLRVQKFEADGDFLSAVGKDVNPDDVDPDDAGTDFEKCTTSCKPGVSGGTGGAFASTFFGHVAVSPVDDNVVVADPGNRRVQEFTMEGAFVRAWGFDVSTTAGTGFEVCTMVASCKAAASGGSGAGQFATNQPARVAVDSAGSIYTVESAGNFRVQKFNPSLSSSGVFAAGHASGTDNNTAPTDVAIDPADDRVLITKAAGSPVERRVLELSLGGSLLETHAVAAGLPATNGLGVKRAGGPIYLSTSTNQRVFVLGTVTPPTATMAPTSDITASSATLNGTVNPNGGRALSIGYHFEYSEDGGVTWTSVPAADQTIPNGTADVQVSQPVGLPPSTALKPNTQYQVRLVARRPFAGGSATSAVQTFTTEPIPPSISGVGARDITGTTALLGAQVNPNRAPTTYRFEYGTDTSYGTTTAVEEAGSGATSVSVSRTVTGLQPNTTYHFRLVATSAGGETEGADRTFTTTTALPQPSARAYEMVSPLDKNGGNIDRDFVDNFSRLSLSGAAVSGDAVAYTSRLQFGDSESGSITPTYVARRATAGWTTEGITPPIENDFPTTTERPKVHGFSDDLSKAFVMSAEELTANASMLNSTWGLYTRRTGEAEPYTLLSFPWTNLGVDPDNARRQSRFEYVAETPDSRHVVFNSTRQLLEDAPADVTTDSNAVYEWVDGSLRLASVPPPGLEFVSDNSNKEAGALTSQSAAYPGQHMLSDDGRRVFFTAPLLGSDGVARGNQLLVREDGTTTRVVSAALPGEQLVSGASPTFWAAKSTDGSVAFFTASAALTPGTDLGSLYRWDANPPAGQPPLTELTQAPASANTAVTGVAAVNDDATSVAFVAGGGLASGAPAGGRNLYLWQQGEGVRFVAPLHPTLDQLLWISRTTNGGRAARISADGERLLFASYAENPSYDITETTPDACRELDVPGEGCRQIYLYDARTGQRTCLTCVPGVPVTGNAELFGNSASDQGRPSLHGPMQPTRNLSADGTRAFFETGRPLVTADRNSKLDVYAWEDADLDGDGELRLISPGVGTTDSKFVDASVSGDDVFFTTRERLVGIDTDNQIDLYDARVGGGIPAQNPPPASPCQGEECQGTPAGAPFLPGVGSGGASHGDLRPGRRPSFSVARLSRAQLAKLARGGRVAVRVRVNRAGRVGLIARAKVGRPMRTVASASKRARRASTVRLGLKLSGSARRALSRTGKLEVRLAVRFSGVREARTSTLRLRRASSSGERGAR